MALTENYAGLRVKHLAFFCFLGFLLCCAPLPAAAQFAKAKKQEAASGQQATGGGVPLRVMLVISDSVRGYRPAVFLSHWDFGPRLARQAEKIFNETFAAVQIVSMVPTDPHALDSFDLVVSIESPDGRHQAAFFSYTEILSAVFVARRTNGQEVFRSQETDTEKGSGNPGGTQDQLGEAVTRKFIQELILNPNVRNLLTPAPPPEAKPARDDSAALASAGLDAAPPPPWPNAGTPPAVAGGASGRP